MHLLRSLFIFFFLICFVRELSIAQTLPSGPQVLTFFSDIDDTEQPYGLYIPKNYDQTKKYPLVVMLHGAGSNHRLSLRRVFGKSNANGETDVEASRYFPEWKDVDFIVASPYARGTAGYQGVPEKDVYDVLDDVKKRFNIDEDRVYLTGLSMGGGGTLWIGLTRPDIWAAIAPVCPAPPKGTDSLAVNAFNLPVHFFHGDKDPVVPVDISRNWVERLKKNGSRAEYKEFPGVQHDSWVNAYENGFIFDWFSPFKRNNYPDRVKFNTMQLKYNKAYWVTFDQVNPGALASIDAKFIGPNKLEVSINNSTGFTLNLKDHPKFKSGDAIQLTINGKKVQAASADVVSLILDKGKWSIGKYTPGNNSKKTGLSGPLSEVFAERHVYVYGTAGNPSAEELKNRMKIAEEAANWSVYRGAFLGRMMFFPRVVADKDVRASDLETSNLVLFGTKETNFLIEEYSGDLPLQLNQEYVKDHGLFYVFPMNGKHIAVSSGLPWWTNYKVEGIRFLPQHFMIINDTKDFLLFKESANTVLSGGYFDNNWKLPAAAIEKIKATGVVSVKE